MIARILKGITLDDVLGLACLVAFWLVLIHAAFILDAVIGGVK